MWMYTSWGGGFDGLAAKSLGGELLVNETEGPLMCGDNETMNPDRFQLTCNLTLEPELHHGTSGKAVAILRLANNQIWKESDGHKQERADLKPSES